MIRAKTRAPGLHVGDVFRHHEGEEGEFEVVRVTPSGAAVRILGPMFAA